jgi:hypothetical protein
MTIFNINPQNILFSNECVGKHHLFTDRDPRFVELLSRDVKVEVFRPGEVIVKEGAKGSSMYILRRGEVEVICSGVSVARLASGSVFGEILLLGAADRRTATVRATEFSDCRVVPREVLQRLLRLFPREKVFFEHLARERMGALKHTAVMAPHHPGKRSPLVKLCTESSVDRTPTLPPLNEGAKGVEYASALSAFSRFFEKPSFRAGGKLKKSSGLDEPRPCVVSDLVSVRKDQPALPPLITRGEDAGWQRSSRIGRESCSPDCDSLDEFCRLSPTKGGAHNRAGKAAVGQGGISPTSPRSPPPPETPRDRFSMYEKASPEKLRRMASPVSPVPSTYSPEKHRRMASPVSLVQLASAKNAAGFPNGHASPCSPRLVELE